MNDQELEQFYREHLEEEIILYLKQKAEISDEEAMHIYYSSKLCNRIYEGEYGIQYLDYHVLVNYLEEELKK